MHVVDVASGARLAKAKPDFESGVLGGSVFRSPDGAYEVRVVERGFEVSGTGGAWSFAPKEADLRKATGTFPYQERISHWLGGHTLDDASHPQVVADALNFGGCPSCLIQDAHRLGTHLRQRCPRWSVFTGDPPVRGLGLSPARFVDPIAITGRAKFIAIAGRAGFAIQRPIGERRVSGVVHV